MSYNRTMQKVFYSKVKVFFYSKGGMLISKNLTVVVTLLCYICMVSANQGSLFLSHDDTENKDYSARNASRIRSDVEDQIFPRPQSTSQPCDTDQMEYRLYRLETQLSEKAESLRGDLREGNRRLQALEWENSQVQRALEGFRSELVRFSRDTRTSPSQRIQDGGMANLEARIEYIATGVQLAVAALRRINDDVHTIKRNLSRLNDITSELLQVQKASTNDRMFDIANRQTFSDDDNNSKRPVRSNLPRNCKEIKDKGAATSGIYTIQPDRSPEPILVLCDMESSGGGWLYIQNRFDGTEDFYLDWDNYKHGFGNLAGEFWLGLEYVYQLAGHELNELLIELVDHDSVKKYAFYSAFSIGSEAEGYRLKVLGGYEGTAGDSLSYHAGARFSTKDMDNDVWNEGSCAQSHGGAWWYRSCDQSNLNGKYLNGPVPAEYIYQGMYWAEFRGPQNSLKQARIMMRPRSGNSPVVSPGGASSKE